MSNNHFDELVDSCIKYAGRQMLKKMADEAPSDEELEDFCFSTDSLDSLVMSDINKQVGRLRLRHLVTLAGKAAAVVLIFIAVTAFAISSSKALRAQFINLFISESEVSVDFSFSDAEENSEASPSVQSEDHIAPGYLPDGYVLEESTTNGYHAHSEYLNEADERLMISRMGIGASHSVDNEHSRVYELEVMGKPAIALESEYMNILFFTSENFEYSITGVISIEDMIPIAEGLE